MRLLALIRGGVINLSTLRIAVLDEYNILFQRLMIYYLFFSLFIEYYKLLLNINRADKLLEMDYSKPGEFENEDDIDKGEEEAEGQEEEDVSQLKSKKPSNKKTSFLSQVDEILAECDPALLRRALFSATVGPLVQDLGTYMWCACLCVSVCFCVFLCISVSVYLSDR